MVGYPVEGEGNEVKINEGGAKRREQKITGDRGFALLGNNLLIFEN